MDYDLPPEVTLITGPVGSGKTEAALDAIVDEQRLNAFGMTWVLLATDQQIHAFRSRLLARCEDNVLFGVEFFNFYKLYERVLNLAGDPQRQINDAARFQILRHVITRAQPDLELFGRIARLPGFIGLVDGLIHELKQGMVLPDTFRAAARTPKDRDLVRIYSDYQQFLQDQHLVDRHGAGWLALDHLDRDPRLAKRVDLLVVDGIDQFHRVHAELLARLAKRVKRAVITLAQSSGEQARRFHRFEQTRALLRQVEDSSWWEQPVAGSPRAPVLDHLVRAVFDSRADQIANDGSVHLLEAPDVPTEVRSVLRRVKRLLLDGVAPESIAIVARQLQAYSGMLRETARAYGVPLVVREGIRLRENPAIALLLTLIDLHTLEFPRREMLDILRSPYLRSPHFTPEQIIALERISLQQQVVRGADIWLDAAVNAANELRDEDGLSETQIDVAIPKPLIEALQAHFERLKPPSAGSVYDLTTWIDGLIGPDRAAQAEDDADDLESDPVPVDHFSLLINIRESLEPDRMALDLAAMRVFRQSLSQIRTAHDLLGDGDQMDWSDFRAELELAVEHATVTPPGGSSHLGRVLATAVAEVRGLPHDHIFLIGLAEGVFPAQESEDAFYPENERRALSLVGVTLQTAGERVDETSLFYQAVGLARQTLTISRFYTDDKGTPCPPSPYWSAVSAAVAVTPERIPVGVAPSLDEAATLSEAGVAAAAALSGEIQVDGLAVYNGLLVYPAWRNVLRGRAIEAWREDRAHAFDGYTGRLIAAELIQVAAERLGPDRKWSASQFNDYGSCPFRFFARRVLHLEELKEPEEGPDVMQRGSIYHEILELTYRQIQKKKLTIAPENADHAVDILQTVAKDVFKQAAGNHGFRESPVWLHEYEGMLRQLIRLVQLDFSEANPFRLGARESKAAHPVAAVLGSAPRVPFGQEKRFTVRIDGPAGSMVTSGVIDRIDLVGDQVVIVDYKSGSTKHPTQDMIDGRDYQMMIYVLAAQQILDRPVAGGLFWHISNLTVSGEIMTTDIAIEQAQTRLHGQILAAREGFFGVSPNQGRCFAHCEYGGLCRFGRGYTQKPVYPSP